MLAKCTQSYSSSLILSFFSLVFLLFALSLLIFLTLLLLLFLLIPCPLVDLLLCLSRSNLVPELQEEHQICLVLRFR